MIEASRKAIRGSDDDRQDGERLAQRGNSSAQPIGDPPDITRTILSAREATGTTPHPLTKESRNENDDLNVSP
eukprot:1279410-Pyramimonas_sp.AAC.1